MILREVNGIYYQMINSESLTKEDIENKKHYIRGLMNVIDKPSSLRYQALQRKSDRDNVSGTSDGLPNTDTGLSP